ncbi:MAG: hypothetical protein RLZZ308_721 [Candidatus Parcubacteria bacterium]|jgi:translation initiation factor 2 gamma subunit (eIF-2gamma)
MVHSVLLKKLFALTGLTSEKTVDFIGNIITLQHKNMYIVDTIASVGIKTHRDETQTVICFGLGHHKDITISFCFDCAFLEYHKEGEEPFHDESHNAEPLTSVTKTATLFFGKDMRIICTEDGNYAYHSRY